jgi:aspartate 1-decarboxylase
MIVELLRSKIHRATVTGTELHYEGSVTVSKELVDAAGMYPYQKVSVVDIDNGNRFDTYIIPTDNTGVVCLNGAAARKVNLGDLVILMTYQLMDEKDIDNYAPIIIKVDSYNHILSSSITRFNVEP